MTVSDAELKHLAERTRVWNDKPVGPGPVVYWMSRDMRAADNWALIVAAQKAHAHKQPLIVVYNLVADYLGGGLRQLDFKLGGLRELEHTLHKLHIPLVVFTGKEAMAEIIHFVKKIDASEVVTDFSPLRVNQTWIVQAATHLTVTLTEVDAHNIVPCWVTSPKQEFAARTIRPKIHKLLPRFLVDFPTLTAHPHKYHGELPANDWEHFARLHVDRTVSPVTWITPGERAAHAALEVFLHERLPQYDDQRNDPSHLTGQSDLSPYFHYGMLAPQRVALAVRHSHVASEAKDAYLEELIIRRELADNYCLYNPHYDSVEGFPAWAKTTLDAHRDDPREFVYSYDEFDRAETHDALWNAAQIQMVHTGKMHGYMRMYWAKKILEWSKTPEHALATAIALNDRYELDGRDPNGYVGVAWSIGGVHDRPWFTRPIFGAIRYMNANGCAKKFDVQRYIAHVTGSTLPL